MASILLLSLSLIDVFNLREGDEMEVAEGGPSARINLVSRAKLKG